MPNLDQFQVLRKLYLSNWWRLLQLTKTSPQYILKGCTDWYNILINIVNNYASLALNIGKSRQYSENILVDFEKRPYPLTNVHNVVFV